MSNKKQLCQASLMLLAILVVLILPNLNALVH